MKRFYKTRIMVEVLSEDEPVITNNLRDIAHEIWMGDWSGKVEILGSRELDSQECALELMGHGSDPEFFNLTETGEVLDP